MSYRSLDICLLVSFSSVETRTGLRSDIQPAWCICIIRIDRPFVLLCVLLAWHIWSANPVQPPFSEAVIVHATPPNCILSSECPDKTSNSITMNDAFGSTPHAAARGPGWCSDTKVRLTTSAPVTSNHFIQAQPTATTPLRSACALYYRNKQAR